VQLAGSLASQAATGVPWSKAHTIRSTPVSSGSQSATRSAAAGVGRGWTWVAKGSEADASAARWARVTHAMVVSLAETTSHSTTMEGKVEERGTGM
jgi:hypothetical protein